MKEMYREIFTRYGLTARDAERIVLDFKEDGKLIDEIANYTKLDPEIVEDIIRRWMVAWEKQ